MLDPILEKKNEIKFKLSNYILKGRRRGLTLRRAANISRDEISTALNHFIENPNSLNLATLLRNMLNSGIWVSKSTLELFFSLLYLVEETKFKSKNHEHKELLETIAQHKPVSGISDANIFQAILSERYFAHKNPRFDPILQIPRSHIHIVLISGVFNEVFSTPAFERGAHHLSQASGIKVSTIQVNGRKNSKYNSQLIHKQLLSQQKKNEKIWLLSFSKGGIDALYFLHSHADEHPNIIGLSTIASPIMGTNHINNRIIQFLNSFSRFRIYQMLNGGKDLFVQELQESLRSDIRHSWFFKHHKELPKKIFYSALALQSQWHQSHVWMILTKFLFQSSHPNDGVVDVHYAQFPSFFKAHNLGAAHGHHLVGTRSSDYSQEALLESLFIFLNWKGYFS